MSGVPYTTSYPASGLTTYLGMLFREETKEKIVHHFWRYTMFWKLKYFSDTEAFSDILEHIR